MHGVLTYHSLFFTFQSRSEAHLLVGHATPMGCPCYAGAVIQLSVDALVLHQAARPFTPLGLHSHHLPQTWPKLCAYNQIFLSTFLCRRLTAKCLHLLLALKHQGAQAFFACCFLCTSATGCKVIYALQKGRVHVGLLGLLHASLFGSTFQSWTTFCCLNRSVIV